MLQNGPAFQRDSPEVIELPDEGDGEGGEEDGSEDKNRQSCCLKNNSINICNLQVWPLLFDTFIYVLQIMHKMKLVKSINSGHK